MRTNRLLVTALLASAMGAPMTGFGGDMNVAQPTTSPGVRVPFLHGLPTGPIASQSELASLERADEWLNSPPLTASALRGKVVLIDFWTYTCINWRRTLPYVRASSRDGKPSHLGIGHRHALGIAVRVKLAPHAQASPGGGCADQIHDDTVAHQRRGAPVLADEREQPVLDRVPLRGAGRQMMDRDGQTARISQPLQLPLPQPHPHAVRAAPIGRDGQALGSRVMRSPDLLPPAPDGLPRKGCRVMVLAHPDPAGMGGQIINAVRHRPPQLLDQEVVHPHRFGRSLGTPRPPAVLEGAHKLLLLGVYRDHRLAGRPRRLDLGIDEGERRIPIRVA